MWDFLTFRRMLTPILIQILFWIAVAVSIYVGIIDILSHQNGSLIKGLQLIIFGPIFARISCEILILFFRINETLTEIKHNQEPQSAEQLLEKMADLKE